MVFGGSISLIVERGRITMNSRNKTFIIGGLIGGVLGVLAAWLYVRAAREK
jgi:hypothetical protein